MSWRSSFPVSVLSSSIVVPIQLHVMLQFSFRLFIPCSPSRFHGPLTAVFTRCSPQLTLVPYSLRLLLLVLAVSLSLFLSPVRKGIAGHSHQCGCCSAVHGACACYQRRFVAATRYHHPCTSVVESLRVDVFSQHFYRCCLFLFVVVCYCLLACH